MPQVTVVGTTSWGTTLGILLARRDVPVTLLARGAEEAETLNRDREHRRLLPGAPFPDALTASADASAALDGADLVVLATPRSACGVTFPPSEAVSAKTRCSSAPSRASSSTPACP